MALELPLEPAIEAIRSRGARRVALQLPEGLKRRSRELAAALEESTGVEVRISAEPCFGACDVPKYLFRDVDLILHFGHLPMPSVNPAGKVLFINAVDRTSPLPALEALLPKLPKAIGLLASAQHVELLGEAEEYLRRKGHEVHIGAGDRRLAVEGQVIGCDFSAASGVAKRVDAFVVLGEGRFHALGVAAATHKPVWVVHPPTGEVYEVGTELEALLRQRHGAIARAKDAQRWGILEGSKMGQARPGLAQELKRRLEAAGRSGTVLLLDYFNPEQLRAFDFEAYVSTACPRIAIDDYLRYPKPILTPPELEILLGDRAWERYEFDQILAPDRPSDAPKP